MYLNKTIIYNSLLIKINYIKIISIPHHNQNLWKLAASLCQYFYWKKSQIFYHVFDKVSSHCQCGICCRNNMQLLGQRMRKTVGMYFLSNQSTKYVGG